MTSPSFIGFKLDEGIGSLDSTQLTSHTILTAAFEQIQTKFYLYVSNIASNPETAFSAVKIFKNNTLFATLDVADAVLSNLGTIVIDSIIYPFVESYIWDATADFLTADDEFTIQLVDFKAEEISTPFNGLVQWPHLDLGALGREKQLIGFDIVSDAPTGVSVSIGYNQNDLSQRTTSYAIDADTLPGMLVPLPVSGPSFDMQLTFEPGQIWEFEAANLYIQDWRVTS